MKRVLANDGIHTRGKEMLERAGFEVSTEKIPQDRLAEVLPDYDAIIVRSATKVRADLIDLCPRLKVIGRAGVGLDNIDVDHARSRDIAVFNTPGASSTSVAELAFAHMFNLARGVNRSNRSMPETGRSEFKKLKKEYSGGFELAGKTLGIIGIGRIGQEVARIGLALRMNVLAVDQKISETLVHIDLFANENMALSVKLRSVPLEVMLQQADFITMHVPFSGGRSIIGGPEMERMKEGACIINTARGGALDEDALLTHIKSGKIGGAGLDVFMGEPQPRQELLDHPNISVTPHIGGSTREAQKNIGIELAQKIIDYFKE